MAAQTSVAWIKRLLCQWSPSALYQSQVWNLTLSAKGFEFLEYLHNWTFCVAALYWLWNNGGVIISSCVRAGTRAPLYWGANKQTAELRRNPMQAKWTQPLKFGKYARGNEICGNYLEIAAKYALVGKPSASACIVQDNKLIIVKKRKGDEGLGEREGGQCLISAPHSSFFSTWCTQIIIMLTKYKMIPGNWNG